MTLDNLLLHYFYTTCTTVFDHYLRLKISATAGNNTAGNSGQLFANIVILQSHDFQKLHPTLGDTFRYVIQ